MKVVETSQGELVVKGAEFLAGPIGHILAGVRELVEQKIPVPTCAGCWSLHRWGFVAGLAIIASAAVIFIGFVLMDHAAKLNLPVWVTFAAVVGPAIMVILGAAVASLLSFLATSVLVYRTHERSLYYEFWSAKYQEYLDGSSNDQERER